MTVIKKGDRVKWCAPGRPYTREGTVVEILEGQRMVKVGLENWSTRWIPAAWVESLLPKIVNRKS